MIQKKILRFLIENRGKSFSVNAIAKNINTDYKLVYTNIQKLEKLVDVKKLGNRNECRFNGLFNHQVFQVEEQRKEEILKSKDLRVIHNDVRQIRNPFYIWLLFGSYAIKSQRKHSDIDFCIITDNKAIHAEINKILNLVPLDLHILNFTTREFQHMLDTKADNVGKEILRNNIILHGSESFYELIKNA